MGRTNVLVGLLVPLVLVAACGEVTGNEDAGLCAQAACEDGGGSAQAGAGAGGHKKAKGKGAGDARAPQGSSPTEVMELPCTVCARAEACCKAGGGTDCSYAAACASAMSSEQQFYLVSCRAALEAWGSGAKIPADVCVF
jgi:hypothetical protein